MSFILTTEQIRNKTKTVTRRLGWNFLKPGDILNAVEKGMGLKKGEKIKKICPIRIVNIEWQRLNYIDALDCVKEGFPNMNPREFIDMFCTYNDCDRFEKVNRIEFEYF